MSSVLWIVFGSEIQKITVERGWSVYCLMKSFTTVSTVYRILSVWSNQGQSRGRDFRETSPDATETFCVRCGIRSFVTVFTLACRWFLPWNTFIHSASPCISLRLILILSSLHSDVFRLWFSDCVRISHLRHACYAPRPSNPPGSDRPNNIWQREQIVNPNCATVSGFLLFPH